MLLSISIFHWFVAVDPSKLTPTLKANYTYNFHFIQFYLPHIFLVFFDFCFTSKIPYLTLLCTHLDSVVEHNKELVFWKWSWVWSWKTIGLEEQELGQIRKTITREGSGVWSGVGQSRIQDQDLT